MSRPVTPTCDQCGKQKQVANHWWTVTPVITHGLITVRQICITTFDPNRAPSEAEKDFCGRECALKFVSEQMGKVQQGEGHHAFRPAAGMSQYHPDVGYSFVCEKCGKTEAEHGMGKVQQ